MPARRVFLLWVGVAGAAVACGRSIAASPPSPQAAVGKPAPAFDVVDTQGRHQTLAGLAGRTVVLEWTSPTCPFAAAQYESGRMQALQKWARAHGVVWLTVLSSHPSRSDWLEPAAAEAFETKRGGQPTALLIDDSGAMGHAYGAMTANHMFVIDRKGVVLYAGGIDDAMSTKAAEVADAHNYVRAALDDVLAGRKVKEATSEPAGCAIAYAG